MTQFFEALFSHAFLQYAVIAGVLAGIACGVTGTFVVVRRLSSLSGGISHAVVGGLGAAAFFGFQTVIGAFVAALAAALAIGVVSLKFRRHEDTLVGALWAVGMALGVVFVARTPGYGVNLLSYLFGNILMVTPGWLLLTAILDAVILLVVLVFYRQLVYVAFDSEYASVRGIPAGAIYLLLLCLVAVTVVLLIQVVGLILVIALLTLPPATAELFSRTTGRMMALSVALNIAVVLAGLVLSFAANLPSGATIILVAGAVYLAGLGISGLRH